MRLWSSATTLRKCWPSIPYLSAHAPRHTTLATVVTVSPGAGSQAVVPVQLSLLPGAAKATRGE